MTLYRGRGPTISTSYSSETAPSAAADDYYHNAAVDHVIYIVDICSAGFTSRVLLCVLYCVGFVYCIARRVYLVARTTWCSVLIVVSS